MELIIKRANNGFLLEYQDDETNEIIHRVVEEPDTIDPAHDRAVATQSLLLTVKEYFGPHYSKHNSHNCRVIIEDSNYKEVN